MFETQLGVVVVGFGGGKQNEHAGRAEMALGFLDQLLADTLLLVIDVYRQVGQVRDVLQAQGQSDAARTAYRSAWDGLSSAPEYRRIVQAKLNALGFDPESVSTPTQE